MRAPPTSGTISAGRKVRTWRIVSSDDARAPDKPSEVSERLNKSALAEEDDSEMRRPNESFRPRKLAMSPRLSALGSRSLGQHQEPVVGVAKDLSLLPLVPPMVVGDQRAEPGIQPIFRFLGINGFEESFAHGSWM